MSADNGIYILVTKDQYRVIHAQAIDNLWYSYLRPHSNNPTLVSTRIVEYFGDSKYTRNIDIARQIAFSMAKRQPILEYGIREIKVDKTWSKIVREAKELAPMEIKILKEENYSKNDWHIKRLEEIISM